MAEGATVTESEIGVKSRGNPKETQLVPDQKIPEASEAKVTTEKNPSLVKVGYNIEDPRTEQEITAGIPWLRNEGLVAIEVDVPSLVELLRAEGLTETQISALKLTFSAARLVDVDAVGAYIGGLHKGSEVVVYTSVPVKIHPEETSPPVTKSRFVTYHSAFPTEEVVNTTLHELKHFVQIEKGVEMPNSWAAESQEAHDQLPTEKEAIEFAAKHTPEFKNKFRINDESGHFKKASEVIPEEAAGGYFTGLVNEGMVARFSEDSLEASLAHEYISNFEDIMEQPKVSHDHVAQFIKKGKELVEMKALSEFELDFMLDSLQAKLTG